MTTTCYFLFEESLCVTFYLYTLSLLVVSCQSLIEGDNFAVICLDSLYNGKIRL